MSSSISYRRYATLVDSMPNSPERTLGERASMINANMRLHVKTSSHKPNSINTTKHIKGSVHRPKNVNQKEYTEREFYNMTSTSVFDK